MNNMIENINVENICNEKENELKSENTCNNSIIKDDTYFENVINNFENIKDKYESNLKSLDYEYSNDYNGDWGYSLNDWKDRYEH